MAEKVKAEGIKRPDSVRVEAMGVAVEVRTDALDDYDVLCAIDEAGADSLRGMLVFVRAVLGDEYDRVIDELRDGDGRLPMSRVAQFVGEVQEKVSALKN